MFFTELPGTQVLLNKRGGFFAAPLFERNGEIYVRFGHTYHRLVANNVVSGTNMVWVEFAGELAARLKPGTLYVHLTPVMAEPRFKLAS